MFRKLFSPILLSVLVLSLFVLPVKAQEADFSWYPSEFELKSGKPGQTESAEIQFKNNIDVDVVFTTFTIVENSNNVDNVIARSIDNNLNTNGKLNVSIDGLQENKLVVAKTSNGKYKFNLSFPDNLKTGNYNFRIILNEDENAQVLSGPVEISVKAEIVQPTVSNELILAVAGLAGAICLVGVVVFIVIGIIKRKRGRADEE